jgi:MFS transporter, DHA2 family, multidrug resistance protein
MNTFSRTTPNRWVVAGSVMLGTIMAVLDSSIVNVALPDMTGSLGATVEEITWVVTGYILSSVVIMPIIALLSSRFGRKRLYIISVVLFTVASMACGLARTLGLMVLFRIVQGIGGGVLMTVSQAILRETFPPEEQGLAMGIFGMGIVLAPAFGPTLGGWLTDSYSWPWVFYVNLPIGIVNILLVSRFVEDPPYLTRSRDRIDWLGVALLTTGLGSLQLMLERGESKDWFQSQQIMALGVIALLGLVLFVWWELGARRPAVDLRLFKNVSFASATALGGVLGMGLFGTLFLLPLFLQRLLGYNAMESGLALMPRSLAMAVLMPIAGRFYNRIGPRFMVAAGLLVSAFSFWELSHLSTGIGVWDIFMPQVWQGVGFSLIFVALSTAALATIDRTRMTAAAGLYNVVRQVFGSVGIALAATQLTRGQMLYRTLLGEHVTAYDPVSRQALESTMAALQARGVDAASAFHQALAFLDLRVFRQATVLAYNHVFLLVTGVFLFSVPLVMFLARAAHVGPVTPAGE